MKPDADLPAEDKTKLAGLWIARLDASEKWRRDYQKRCKRIVKRYENERLSGTGSSINDQRRFAILWANIQTIGPAVYARVPQAVVTRRYKNDDKVSRYAAEVLERALNFAIDQYDFDDLMRLARDDYLLLAQGVSWVRYVPHQQTQTPAEPGEQPEDDEGPQITNTAESDGASGLITYQETICDHVAFTDFGMEPCRAWDETGYVWRRVYMTREDMVERFGPVGKEVPLDWGPEKKREDDETTRKAQIYEIWDKTAGKVFWISKAWNTGPLDQMDDPLGLDDFFPCPRPLTGTLPPDKYVPVPDFVYYQDQAEEVDELTNRIGKLTDALRMVGIYAGEENTTLQNIFAGDQNTLIPVPSMASLSDKGGLKGIVEWMPVDMVIETLKGCFEARRQIMEDIFQITGISDIVRGSSDPNETATAQGIKQQWGSLRIRDRQKEMARFARDVLRIKSQIIAKFFTPETLKAMTDVKLLTQAEKQQMQTVMQLAQQNPQLMQQFGEQLQLMDAPTWEEVVGLLRNDAMRTFLVDVETDSTIEPNESEEKQRRVEYITAFTQFLGAALPVLQIYPKAAPLIGEAVKFLNRGFRVGREMEDILDTTFQQIAQIPPPQPDQQQPQGDPNAPKVAQIEMQTEKIKQDGENQRAQLSAQMQGPQLQLKAQDQQIKMAALQRDPRPQANA